MDNLGCYKEILKNKTFSECDEHWTEIMNTRENLTSYQYFCQPQSVKSLEMNRCVRD